MTGADTQRVAERFATTSAATGRLVFDPRVPAWSVLDTDLGRRRWATWGDLVWPLRDAAAALGLPPLSAAQLHECERVARGLDHAALRAKALGEEAERARRLREAPAIDWDSLRAELEGRGRWPSNRVKAEH